MVTSFSRLLESPHETKYAQYGATSPVIWVLKNMPSTKRLAGSTPLSQKVTPWRTPRKLNSSRQVGLINLHLRPLNTQPRAS